MSPSCCCAGRRRVVLAGAGALVLAHMPGRVCAASDVVVSMAGTPSGSHVWFRPRGVLIKSGQSVQWRNDDAGNVHTVTAYHPDNGKPLRIPADATAWNSAYLMPGGSFTLVFDVPGVYDYFCIPHEQAGMVGRIVVGRPDTGDLLYSDTDALLPEKALANLPDIGDIVVHTVVE